MRKLFLGLIILSIILVIIFLIYFFIYNAIPEKAVVRKPNSTETIDEAHVNWMMNELGSYKLHEDIDGKKAEFEVVLSDTGDIYNIMVDKNHPVISEGKALDPDLRITTTEAGVKKVLESLTPKTEIKTLYSEGLFSFEFLKEYDTLLYMGYKTIFDNVQ